MPRGRKIGKKSNGGERENVKEKRKRKDEGKWMLKG
jgi:hypothetical protein